VPKIGEVEAMCGLVVDRDGAVHAELTVDVH
jgi:hypothetical protein